jgi:hypothetical protein
VFLANIGDGDQRLGTAAQFAAGMAALPAQGASGAPPGTFRAGCIHKKGLSAGCRAVIAA